MKTSQTPIGMAGSNKIVKIVKAEDFLKLIEDVLTEQIVPTRHGFFRLEEGERKIFKEGIIREIIKYRIPDLVGIQKNGVYAVFYHYGEKVLRIMLDIQPEEIRVVTFYLVRSDEIPRI